MKNAMRKILTAILLTLFGASLSAQRLPWQDTTLTLDERVDWLVGHLTLDEKLSLMVHQNPAVPSVGLPAYSWWNEALHGVARAGEATVYPMPIALAATFDPALVGRVFGQVAAEAHRKHAEAQDTGYRGDYGGLTFFTPNINIFRDPRWGRGMETYGEDPCLTALMGLACVHGLQHPDVEDNAPIQNSKFKIQNSQSTIQNSKFKIHNSPIATAACLKHFAVHSGPEGIRHEFDSRVTDADLRTTYLPAFEYIIRHSDVAQVMCGYNRLNGEPCCTNRRLFDILRHEWHYDGLLVTDCWALNDAYEQDTVIPRHRTHATAAAAYGDAFGREVDLECGSGLPALREAVEQGLVPMEQVDRHVRRLLRVRLAVEDAHHSKFRIQNSKFTLPLESAASSMVLLKNNGVLPLRGLPNLILDGPNAYDSLMPLGNYNGTPRHTVTIGEALANDVKRGLISSAMPTVVYVGGLSPQLEGEELQVEQEGFLKGDRTLIELPREQVEAIKAHKAQGRQVVLVLCSGSAVALENVIDYCDAVLVGWYGGQDMGTAVRQLLFGERDDFGRLPVTFYRSTSDLPPFDDYDMDRRTYRYADPGQVEFPFGFGLSYSFHQLWGAPAFNADSLVLTGLVSQCATDAPRAASHRTVVQVYVKDDSAPDGPVKQLVAVQPVQTVDFDYKVPFRIAIDPFWLRRYNPQTGLMEEPADGTAMTLQVGFSSDDRDLTDIPFRYHKPKSR